MITWGIIILVNWTGFVRAITIVHVTPTISKYLIDHVPKVYMHEFLFWNNLFYGIVNCLALDLNIFVIISNQVLEHAPGVSP
jgi:hypothetical protein